MKQGRNSPCSCGSGKKYKQCCGLKAQQRSSRWSLYALIIVGVALVGGMTALLVSAVNAPSTDGRVWSPEHGHWHDSSGRELGAGAAPGAAGATPPPGPAPAGKVWSAEHGHWHDA